MFVFAIFLSVCVIEIQNRVLIYPYSTRQHFPYKPGCYLNTIQHFLSFNESYSPRDGKTCEKYTCDFDGYTYITSCTDTFEGDCVKVTGNKTLPYPSCCDYLDCSKRNKTSLPQITPELISDNVTQNTNTEDIGSNLTNETNFTTETSQELSESRDEQSSSLNETFDFTNENKSSESFQSQDKSTVSLEVNNQDDEDISETTEMSPTESNILPKPSNSTNGNISSNSFSSQDLSQIDQNNNDENFPETILMTMPDNETLPTATDTLETNEKTVENNENGSVDETVTKNDIESKGIEESPTENEETE